MFRLRISHSYGGEAPMKLLSQHAYSTKERAVEEAFRLVPLDADINWLHSSSPDDVKFDFAKDGLRFQLWVDAMPIDCPLWDLTRDDSVLQMPVFAPDRGFHFR